MGTLLAKFLAGGAAGLIAWAIVEPAKPQLNTDAWGQWERLLILTFGALVGLVVGGYDGFTRGGRVHTIRGLAFGCVVGAMGGLFGYEIGGGVGHALFGSQLFSGGNLILQMVARTVVFMPMGLFLGAAIGGSTLTWKRTVQGAVGGAIGGLIGGMIFDPIGVLFASTILTVQNQTRGEVGGPPRAVALTLMGAAIGLFIGLVEHLTRSAWLRIQYGRNEFKEWSLDGAETFIGRSEGASVPLRGDPAVQPVHAVIRKQGNSYVLSDGGSQVGTLLNGQFIQQAVLSPGSLIQIGSFQLQFLVKGAPAPAFTPDGPRPHSLSPQPLAAHPYPNVPQPAHAAQMGAQTVAFASPAMVGFSVVAMDGPHAGQKFPVSGVVEIGREGANIKLPGDANASRRHATLSPLQSGVLLTDLGSTNGSYLNGQRVQTGEARSGDVIRIGNSSFRVEAG